MLACPGTETGLGCEPCDYPAKGRCHCMYMLALQALSCLVLHNRSWLGIVEVDPLCFV